MSAGSVGLRDLRLYRAAFWLKPILASSHECLRLYNYHSAMPPRLNPELIVAAIDGFQEQKKRIDVQIAELRQMLGGNSTHVAAPPEARSRRRTLSAAARARIAAAQRKRWAAQRRASSGAKTAAAPARKKRRLSAAGRRAIIEATKRRWAAVRSARKR